MTRPDPTPWYPFGNREQCSLRRPLLDGEVWTLPDGRVAYEVSVGLDGSKIEWGTRDSIGEAKTRVLEVMESKRAAGPD